MLYMNPKLVRTFRLYALDMNSTGVEREHDIISIHRSSAAWGLLLFERPQLLHVYLYIWQVLSFHNYLI